MQEDTVEPFQGSSAWLITARSHLMDRIVPDCEQILLPAKREAGGVLHYGRGPLPDLQEPQGRLARIRRQTRARRAVAAEALFDLRRHSPQNWAHFLNQHLPLVFRLCTLMELDPGRATLVLPENVPTYIRAAADLFGFDVIATDDGLDGDGIVSELTPWMAVRAAQHLWIDHPHVHAVMARVDATGAPPPEKVFLARRDTRRLENQPAVENWLAARGFVTLYPEDLDPAGQLRLFRGARHIVAVHGAGQAPFLYSGSAGRLEQMVEILPCGHMTDVYRVMADQVGCKWIGVRGKLKPEYVMPAYRTKGIFKEFSLDSFEVDLASLERAFELAQI